MSKRIEQHIPITGRDKGMARNPSGCVNNPTHITLSLYYSLGGDNLFTGKTEPRGYYISADVEQRGTLDIGSSVCCLLGSGVKQCVLEVNRQSDKQQEIAATLAANMGNAMMAWCRNEYGVLYDEPAEFFPDAKKRPVPAQLPKVKKQEEPAKPVPPIRGMKLLTAEIIKKLEKHPFGSQEGKLDDAEVLVKFFGGGACTWLVTEGEKQEDGDWEFFGKVTLGDEWEWGYFRLSELAEMKFPPFNLGVERDMYMGHKPLVRDLAA